jgi:hypothetical protein
LEAEIIESRICYLECSRENVGNGFILNKIVFANQRPPVEHGPDLKSFIPLVVADFERNGKFASPYYPLSFTICKVRR